MKTTTARTRPKTRPKGKPPSKRGDGVARPSVRTPFLEDVITGRRRELKAMREAIEAAGLPIADALDEISAAFALAWSLGYREVRIDNDRITLLGDWTPRAIARRLREAKAAG